MAHQPSQSDRAPNEGLTARAEAALTHPATLLALATLLVNDLVFKWLWPDTWITGKLSDLAWIIFAPPLLALPLTFLARRNPFAQKAAWVIAYIGLPLLYAAYNAFDPLHNAVIAGFSLLRGTPGGSPFDPTDSIVIPFGMATAIWVWRRANVDSRTTTIGLGLLVATVAGVVSVASSVLPTTGITAVGSMQSGGIVAHDSSEFAPAYFVSTDGGFTWTKTGMIGYWDVEWGHKSIVTPRGEYVIDEGTIRRIPERDGASDYSPPTDDVVRHRRAVRAATRHFGNFRNISTAPSAITYDENSGNLVAAMGVQGVIVQTPNEHWHPVSVSSYEPIELVPGEIFRRINNYPFWILALAAALSAVALSLSIALVGHAVGANKGLFLWVSVAVAFSFVAIFGFPDEFEPFTVVGALQGFPVPAATASALISCIVIGTLWPRRRYLLAATMSFSLIFALCYLCFYLWMGGYIAFVTSKLFLVVLVSVAGFMLGGWVRNDWRANLRLEN